MTDAAPHGSCIICGHDRLFASWVEGGKYGVCLACRDRATQTVTPPPVGALGDEALRHIYVDAVQASPDDGPPEELGRQGLSAVRDHILATLAAQAGDPEALGRVAQEGCRQGYRDRGWSIPKDDIIIGEWLLEYAAQAVAARVEAAHARMVAALRRLARQWVQDFEEFQQCPVKRDDGYARALQHRLGERRHCAQELLGVVTFPSPAVELIEAEARAGRAYAELVDASRDADTSVGMSSYNRADRELTAAFDALRALDGIPGPSPSPVSRGQIAHDALRAVDMCRSIITTAVSRLRASGALGKNDEALLENMTRLMDAWRTAEGAS